MNITIVFVYYFFANNTFHFHQHIANINITTYLSSRHLSCHLNHSYNHNIVSRHLSRHLSSLSTHNTAIEGSWESKSFFLVACSLSSFKSHCIDSYSYIALQPSYKTTSSEFFERCSCSCRIYLAELPV